MHISKPTSTPIEMLDIREINPQISECQIKVCYVQDAPNRNGTIITKDSAKSLAIGLRGCPIVGKYNKENKDYEEHNEIFTIDDETDEIHFVPETVPYGFVDLNAPIWFQRFIDDDGEEREYLCTKGYLWTDAFPECRRILEHGNNQSMELNEKNLKGEWTKIENSDHEFFIINEGLIQKLCILGENFEPCFEGAQIKATFSLDESFAANMYSLVSNMKAILSSKGGNSLEDIKKKKDDDVSDIVVEEKNPEETKDNTPANDNTSTEDNTPTEDNTSTDDNTPTEGDDTPEGNNDDVPTNNALINEPSASVDEPAVEVENTPQNEPSFEEKFSEAQETIVALNHTIEGLQSSIAALQSENDTFREANEALKEFKLATERTEKKALIDKFSLLSEEDTKDVRDNIDTYSLDEIEAKLCVIGVRKGIFSLEGTHDNKDMNMTFSLGDSSNNNIEGLSDWVKAVKENERN